MGTTANGATAPALDPSVKVEGFRADAGIVIEEPLV